MKTKEEIIEYLVKKYTEVSKEYEGSCWDSGTEDKSGAQVDLFDEIFEECFGVKDIYPDDGYLMTGGRDLEIVVKEAIK